MAEERRLEKEIEFDASPEEVWEAVATGPGLSCWFVPHVFDPPEGGVGARVRADFGSGNISETTITEWEPGKRYTSKEDGAVEAVEFLVEGRDGGGTVLRLVQSGITGEDWEMEYHSRGWDGFFANLRRYFTHFRGFRVANVLAMNFTNLDKDGIWTAFHSALGTRPTLAVGDTVRLEPAGLDPIEGIVEVHEAGVLGVRSAHGVHFFSGDGAWGMVTLNHYLYGTDVDRESLTTVWQGWLDGLFPPSAYQPPQE